MAGDKMKRTEHGAAQQEQVEREMTPEERAKAERKLAEAAEKRMRDAEANLERAQERYNHGQSKNRKKDLETLRRRQNEYNEAKKHLEGLAAATDKFGNQKYSEETLRNLEEAGVETDPEEASVEERIQAAREEGYQMAQKELRNMLAGRSPEKALEDLTADITSLEAEIKHMEGVIYFDPDMKAHQARMLDEARGQLDSMKRRQQMMQALTGTAEPVGLNETEAEAEAETVPLGEQQAAGSMTDMEPEETQSAEKKTISSEDFIDVDKVPFPDSAARTQWKLRHDSAVQTAVLLKDISILERLNEIEREEYENYVSASESGFETVELEMMGKGPEAEQSEAEQQATEGQDEEEVIILPDGTEVIGHGTSTVEQREPVTIEVTLEPAERERKVEDITKRVRKRKPFKYYRTKVVAFVLSAISALSLAGCAARNAKMADQDFLEDYVRRGDDKQAEAYTDMVVGDRQTVELRGGQKFYIDFDSGKARGDGEAGGSEVDAGAETGGLTAEEVGDLSQDTRHESAHGVRYDYSLEYENPAKLKADGTGLNRFGTDKSEVFGDIEMTIDEFYAICFNQPETAATNASPFKRSVLEKAGFENVDQLTPQKLDEMLSTGANAKEDQARLLEALEKALRDPNTKFEFYEEYDREQSHYMYNMVENGENTPENLGINVSWIQRHGDKQVRISIPVYDEAGKIIGYETGDYNLGCGFQLNYEQVKVTVDDNGEITSVEVIETQPEEQSDEQVVEDQGGDEEEESGDEEEGSEEEESSDEEESSEEEESGEEETGGDEETGGEEETGGDEDQDEEDEDQPEEQSDEQDEDEGGEEEQEEDQSEEDQGGDEEEESEEEEQGGEDQEEEEQEESEEEEQGGEDQEEEEQEESEEESDEEKQKSGENEQRVVEQGGQTGEVQQQEDVTQDEDNPATTEKEVEEQRTSGEEIVTGQEADNQLDEEAAAAAAAAQEAAREAAEQQTALEQGSEEGQAAADDLMAQLEARRQAEAQAAAQEAQRQAEALSQAITSNDGGVFSGAEDWQPMSGEVYNTETGTTYTPGEQQMQEPGVENVQ